MVAVVDEELKHKMEKREVHKLGEHCKKVYSSMEGFYCHSWT